ncbi:MAG: hypothetical protein V2A73_05370 [Pseudomonadota bacterium]
MRSHDRQHLFLVLGTLLAAVAFASPARADTQAGSYGDRTLDGRTHNFLMPTGELVPAGDAVVQVHELGMYNSVALGLTDRFEVSAAVPIIPLFTILHARMGLLPPSSNLRLVVGGGVLLPLIGDDDKDSPRGWEASATLAYHTPKMNLHVTMTALGSTGAGDDTVSGILTGGVTLKIGRKVALMADVVKIRDGCDVGSAPVVGIKLMGEHFDTDLGLVFLSFDDEKADGGSFDVALPVISMSYRY